MPGTLVRTSDSDAARELCARVYFPHRLTVLHDPGQFAMSLSAARLGPVSVGLLGYSGEVRLETAELGTGYEVNVPLTGRLRTWTGQADVCAAPGLAAVYRPDGRTMLEGWAGGGQLFGLKIERAAFEAELAELTGAPVRSVIRLGPSLDLSRGPGAQWRALARSLLALVRDPDGPLAQPMAARPLAHSVMTALLLLLLFGSGNRDESVFPDPDSADLHRPNVREHLVFGTGLHACPGAPMARAEIRVALETLLGRLPGLRLADGYEPAYIASYFFRGLESLQVTW